MSKETTSDVAAIISAALSEDIGAGDATSLATIPSRLLLHGRFLAKTDGVLAGLNVAESVFKALDTGCAFEASAKDGERVGKGTVFASVAGPGRAILSGERTALNFLQRMCGIATTTRAFVEAVKGTEAIILDTRKTAPGLRVLDKMAVRLGGGTNHRVGLFDMVLIKDNHIDAAGGISDAVQAVRESSFAQLPIEVECRSLEDVDEAMRLPVARILLDNMDAGMLRKAVARVGGRIPLEASGNVTLKNVRTIAETGVQFISVGALTHSVKAMDISMKITG